VLIVANDARYLGRWVNGRFANAAGTVFLLAMVVVSVVTVPLLFLTKAGQ
jgi:manganese transport protein